MSYINKRKVHRQAKIKWWGWLLIALFFFGMWVAHQSIHQMR